jgi:hypothetical protein
MKTFVFGGFAALVLLLSACGNCPAGYAGSNGACYPAYGAGYQSYGGYPGVGYGYPGYPGVGAPVPVGVPVIVGPH